MNNDLKREQTADRSYKTDIKDIYNRVRLGIVPTGLNRFP